LSSALNIVRTFRVKGEHGFEVVFDCPEFVDGWLEWYRMALSAPDLKVARMVGNPGYGHPPSVLFEDVAQNWSGWSGVKSWTAMEGECRLSATSDSTGHVTFQFEISRVERPQSWSTQVSVVVEAGQLERLAAEAHEFFDQRV